MAAWAIVTGLMSIGAAIGVHAAIPHAWLLALSGALSLALGAALALDPGPGLLSLVWLIGVYALVAGLTELAFAVRVRTLQRGAGQTIAHLTNLA